MIKEQKDTILRLQKRIDELESAQKRFQTVCLSEKERIKELNCLYRIAQCVVLELDADSALNKIVQIVPEGWQYPEKACSCIKIQGKEYTSTPFFTSATFLKEGIFFENQPVGEIIIFYDDIVIPKIGSLFMFEEEKLLNGIANIISLYLKKLRDDENRKLIQEQILHMDRLSTIGRLTAGVAHELNEPLSNILGLAQLSLKSEGLSEPIRKDLNKIEDRVLYARDIIKNLMDFSRQSSIKRERVDLNLLIDDSLSFLESRCEKHNIVVKKEYSTDEINIFVDPVQIKQVITNICVNSIQAMGHDGVLKLTTQLTPANAIITFHDTGPGIPKENISKAFVPFFTTKDVGEGTGLGLSVVYGIVQNHKGNIKVNSQPDKGTAFHVTLPLEANL